MLCELVPPCPFPTTITITPRAPAQKNHYTIGTYTKTVTTRAPPTKIRLGNYFPDYINNTYRSAIAKHLINNRECASTFSADLFTILSWSHSDFYRKVLETMYILTHKASLCKEMECLLGLYVSTIKHSPPVIYFSLHYRVYLPNFS